MNKNGVFILIVFSLFYCVTLKAFTFSTLNSIAPAYYFPVTVTNSQNIAVPSGFQVLVIANPSADSSIYASDLSNINFQDGKGNVLPSWIELGNSSASNSSLFWVKLNSPIPANGSLIIYQVVYAPKNSAFSTQTGAAPHLTTPYGKNDSGKIVFTEYGGVSWTGFTAHGGGTWDTTNGYLQQTSTSGAGLNGGPSYISTNTYPVNGKYILEGAFSYSGHTNARIGLIANATISAGGSDDVMAYRFIGQEGVNNNNGFISFLNDLVGWVSNASLAGNVNTGYTMQIINNTGNWTGKLFSG